MDETLNYGFPFPECSPPLVQDASDIEQLRDLALAVDEEVQALYDTTSQLLTHPECCRMQSTPVLVSSPTQTAILDYDLFNFDNSVGQEMSDTVNGVLKITEDGWYLISHFVVASVSGVNNAPIIEARFVINGVGSTNWTTRSNNANISATTLRTCQGTEMLRMSAGDTITTEVFNFAVSPLGNWNVEGRLFAYQVVAV